MVPSSAKVLENSCFFLLFSSFFFFFNLHLRRLSWLSYFMNLFLNMFAAFPPVINIPLSSFLYWQIIFCFQRCPSGHNIGLPSKKWFESFWALKLSMENFNFCSSISLWNSMSKSYSEFFLCSWNLHSMRDMYVSWGGGLRLLSKVRCLGSVIE